VLPNSEVTQELKTVSGVMLKLVPQGCEGEGLQQVLNDPLGDGRPHYLEVTGRGDGDDVSPVPCRAHRADHVQAVDVGEVHVEQDQVHRT